jgi:hypothetical protein
MSRESPLPPTLAPLGLNRVQAAAYVGVSPSLFDEMVNDGRMPVARRANTRKLWLLDELRGAAFGLPADSEAKSESADFWEGFAKA